MSENTIFQSILDTTLAKYDTLGSDLRCPSVEIVNRWWFKFLEGDLTLAPIGANVKSASFIPLGLKSAFPQCFAPETTNSLIVDFVSQIKYLFDRCLFAPPLQAKH